MSHPYFEHFGLLKLFKLFDLFEHLKKIEKNSGPRQGVHNKATIEEL